MRTSEMSGIIRTRKRNNYTVVDKTPFEDERLTWAARGVLAYLLTKPDDWKVRVNDLLRKAPGCGRDQMRKILAEIEAYGYITREKVWNTQTKQIDWDTIVHEAPQPPDEAKIANLESRYKRRKKEAKQATEIQAMEQCPEIQGIEIQCIENTSIYLVPNVPSTESRESVTPAPAKRAERVSPPPTPKQTNLDSFNEAIVIFKQLSGKTPAPALVTLIVTRVTDMDKWRATIEGWAGCGFNPMNVIDMLDWYDHPQKMSARLARNSTPRSNGHATRPPADLPMRTAADDAGKKVTSPEDRRRIMEETQAKLRAGK